MDPAIRLEPARPCDARLIAILSRDLIEHGLPWRWRRGALLRMVADPETIVLVARKERRIVGFAVMSFDWGRSRAHLVLLAVEPPLRRRGLGRELVRWLEVVARRGGIARVGLEVRASSGAAQHFYKTLGYRESGRIAGYYQGREDAVQMVSDVGARVAQTMPPAQRAWRY